MKNLAILTLLLVTGCTSPSTKQAIDAQRTIETKQDEVYTKLSTNYKIYLFNAIMACKTPEEFNTIWLQREALETYTIQWERLRAYRMLTIDRKLYDDQGILDLEIKKLKAFFEETK